ncbi:MAG: hypothetical protein Aurels2KO_47750 [Aureliella sp.]
MNSSTSSRPAQSATARIRGPIPQHNALPDQLALEQLAVDTTTVNAECETLHFPPKQPASTAQPDPKNTTSEMCRELRLLSLKCGTQCISIWRMKVNTRGKEETVTALDRTGELHDAWIADVQDNTEVALRTQKRTMRLVANSPNLVAVSYCLPFDSNSAVTFLLPQSKLTDDTDLLLKQFEYSAARIKLVMLRSEAKIQRERVARLEATVATQSSEPEAQVDLQNNNFDLPALIKHCVFSKRTKTAVAATFAIALACMCPLPYTLKCEAVCEPATRRIVNVPFESQLREVHVVPGQAISEGELLATLDDGTLKSELAALTAELRQASQRHHAALSKGEAANAGIEALEVARLKQEIDQVNTKLNSTRICAPVDGVIVTGDLHGIQGAALEIGQDLFEIAPLDRMKFEVAIPEAQILDADSTQSATVLLSARPWEKIEAPLARIHPRSEMRNDESVFVGEIFIDNADQTIRPGMRGTARLNLGMRAAGWILIQKPFTTARHYLGW